MLMCQNIWSTIIICLFFGVNIMSANLSEHPLQGSLQHSSSTNPSSIINDFSAHAPNANNLQESRGWKKSALPFLLGITLKMTTLLPMISSLMTVIGGVALVASKLALIISVGIAMHYYMASKHQTQSFRQPLSHSPIYDPVLPVTPYPVSHRLSVQSS